MQLFVIKKIFHRASFTLFGDIAQSIYRHGIHDDWEALNKKVWNDEAIILYLNKSYRSTIEIMEAASKVLSKIANMPRADAVIRHGEPVNYLDVVGEHGRAIACINCIINRMEQGNVNIAVILSKPDYCQEFSIKIQELLSTKNTAIIKSLSPQDLTYDGGICVLSAALSKGLEFDSVIVADAERFPDNAQGIKQQYVSMTRAMHTLDVIKRI